MRTSLSQVWFPAAIALATLVAIAYVGCAAYGIDLLPITSTVAGPTRSHATDLKKNTSDDDGTMAFIITTQIMNAGN